jgi:DNA-directed RNA polymerase specialized sigma24 family protein
MARVVECRFLAGISTQETAESLRVSPRTVEGEWARARGRMSAFGGAGGSTVVG